MNILTNSPLPDAFINFLNNNGLDPSIYTSADTLPRYIRLKPGYEEKLNDIEEELGCKLTLVDWLPNFYSLPPRVHIANSSVYQLGKLYGIDAASGAAVSALNIAPGDHVLDLCAKLCMILELLGDSGSVTGVDVARHRLAACRTMVQKYGLGNHCRLFVADGTSFSVVPTRVSEASESSDESTLGKKLDIFKEWTSKRPWKERKNAEKARKANLSHLTTQIRDPEMIFYGRHSGVIGCTKDELYQIYSDDELSHRGYDKVLVDAECTHDGSIRHVQKFEHWGWETLQRRVLDAERTDDLTNLQFRLLSNGFRLLKAGGLLIYSTCSLTVSQNEGVIERFLLENSSAELQEIDGSHSWPCKSGRIPKTLRFDPLTSQTSGLFVAKFAKLST
ncbi:hypothetical protein KSS87_022211 [Heliosperma pusillum]|nr:hypothetical protein KSS87_022211 [Heliosperma pusillum]